MRTRKRRRLCWLAAALGLWLLSERRLATHHIPDADTGSPMWPELSELKFSMRPLTQAEALQTTAALEPACIKSPPFTGQVRNQQMPLPHRETTSINLGPRLAAYFGTLHSHTADSDGIGSVESAYAYARDQAHLDFFAVTDHPEFWLFQKEKTFEHQRQVAQASAREGFVPLLGFEYSHLALGHYVVLNTTAVRQGFDGDLRAFYAWLKEPAQRDALVMFAHPGFHDYRFGYEFDHFRFEPELREKFVAVEVIHWSEFLRYFRGYFGVIPYIDEAIRMGWWVGAAASQDVHYGNWGSRDPSRLAMLLPNLSLEAIVDALRRRHFYATTNRDLQFAVNVERKDGGWAMMGDWIKASELPPAEATVKVRYYDHDCVEKPYRLEAVLDGNVVATYDFIRSDGSLSPANAGELTLRVPLDRQRLPQRFGLYFRFYQGEDHETFTLSSPLFFDMSR